MTPDPIVRRLEALARVSPDLRDAAHVYERIIPALCDADLRPMPVSLNGEEARAKLGRGVPLLDGLDLDLNVTAFRDLIIRLSLAVEAAAEESRLPSNAARHLREAVERNALETHGLLRGVASGDMPAVAAAAGRCGLEPALVWALALNAFRPALWSWRRQLSPLIAEGAWMKGSCPVCGSVAALAELRDNTQAKHLRCFQCGADWPFPRLQCAFCGNEDHRTLGIIYDEERKETQRAETCEKCRGYLKVVVSFDPTPAEQLAVADLETLHLDLTARTRGYERPVRLAS